MFWYQVVFLKLYVLISFSCNLANSQFSNDNDTTLTSYPYQTALGLSPGSPDQRVKLQNMGSQPVSGYYPYNSLAQSTNLSSQNFSNYYALLAQQGRPSYVYPPIDTQKGGLNYPQPGMGYQQPGIGYPQAGIGYPQPGIGYPQPGIGYPQPGIGYPQPGIGYPQPGMGYPPPPLGYPPLGVGYSPQNIGYPQPYQPLGGLGFGYAGAKYPYHGYAMSNVAPPQGGQGIGQQQHSYGLIPDPYANINTETVDVDPEFHRNILGWPAISTSEGSVGSVEGSANQGAQNIQPRYDIKIDLQTSNFTQIPSNLMKPIVTNKEFTTSIRRTFVYDSSKPGETKAVNLHFVNGEPITTTPPPTTTENEKVEGPKGFTIKPRRFMDVPTSCPKGTLLAHNGKCLSPFVAASIGIAKNNATIGIAKNNTTEDVITTQAPSNDENDI